MTESTSGRGTVLAGRFTLEDLLEDTDGARLWRATDETLARAVAVRVLSARDPRARAMLVAARTSATVTEPHLLRVLDAAAEDDLAYVVNEWGSGVTLDRLLADGPLPGRRAAWVVKEVADAVTAAHRHGVAHGRLLPENVMVSDSGSVKLIGFVVDAVLRGREHQRVTGGAPLSEHEADVVNLGALLYAALVGRWPGTEGSTLPPAPVDQGRPLRPRQVRAGVPRPLDSICDRVLNAEADSVTSPLETAHDVAAALADYIGDPAGAPAVAYAATGLLGGDAEQPGSPDGAGNRPRPGSGAGGEPESSPAADDPERTQAGVPVFSEEDTAAGRRDASPSTAGSEPRRPAGRTGDSTGSTGVRRPVGSGARHLGARRRRAPRPLARPDR